MGYIYKIWNDNNNKVYIGQTTVGVQTRWEQHLYNARNQPNAVYAAMRKYGVETFHIETVEECENEELDNRERYWISYYDSYKNGYNSTIGGTNIQPTGKKHKLLDNKLIYKYWDEGYTVCDICELLKYSHDQVVEHLKDYENYSIEESKRRGIKKCVESKRKKVYQYDKEGNLLNVYNDSKTASECTGVQYGNILSCLEHKRNSAGGFCWEYEGIIPEIEQKTKIYQYDLDGNLIGVYKTKTEAAKAVGCNPSTLSKYFNGLTQKCGNCKWEEK